MNLGHGPALDLGVGRVRTEFFATLDVDAFPVRDGWLDALREQLDDGNVVVGGHMHRGFAHPSMLAMRTRDFRDRKHSFIRSPWKPGEFVHGQSWDVAERISMRPAAKNCGRSTSVAKEPCLGSPVGGSRKRRWTLLKFCG